MNKEIIGKVFIFIAGAAVGSAVTWKLLKTKYEQIANEEIESVKEAYKQKEREEHDEEVDENRFHVDESVENSKEKEDLINKAIKIAAKSGYIRPEENDDFDEDEEEEDSYMIYGPEVISPEEFGEEDYGIISLNYHTDGVVTNERGKIVANAKELLGDDFATHFGDYDYDPDTVYVKNDEQEVYYEVLKDYRAYSEIE